MKKLKDGLKAEMGRREKEVSCPMWEEGQKDQEKEIQKERREQKPKGNKVKTNTRNKCKKGREAESLKSRNSM